jgi:hypothetical protein
MSASCSVAARQPQPPSHLKRSRFARDATCSILVLVILTLPALLSLPTTDEALTTDAQLVGKEADDYIAQEARDNPAFARFLKTTEVNLSAKGWKKQPNGSLVLVRRVQTRERSALWKLFNNVVRGGVRAQELKRGSSSSCSRSEAG